MKLDFFRPKNINPLEEKEKPIWAREKKTMTTDREFLSTSDDELEIARDVFSHDGCACIWMWLDCGIASLRLLSRLLLLIEQYFILSEILQIIILSILITKLQ